MAKLFKTKGILLSNTKYSETSLISKVFTKRFGLQSYITNNVRSKSGKFDASVFQPGNLLDMVVYYNPQKNLQRIKEVRLDYFYQQLSQDIHYSQLMIYIMEILKKVLQEGQTVEDFFDYSYNSLTKLDQEETPRIHFLLTFLLRTSGYLGFAPHGKYSSKTPVFDLEAGRFVSQPPSHDHSLSPMESRALSQLIHGGPDGRGLPSSYNGRYINLLKKIELYYKLHLPNFNFTHSLEVLRTLVGR